jgi:small subunit ribosomal protein S10
MAKKEEQLQKERLRLRVRSYDAKLIDNSVRQIIEAIKRQGGDVRGPTPLPTEFRRYSVNRSTFVHKKSGEQFEMRVHKRLIDIISPNQKIIESLTDLNLPAGVDVEIKMG